MRRRSLPVVFEPVGLRAEARRGTTILEAAWRAGIAIPSECGGRGTCGRCRIIVQDPAAVGPLTTGEAELLSRSEVELDYRLACQATVEDALVVTIPGESREARRRFQATGLEGHVRVDPSIKKIHIPRLDSTGREPTGERLLEAAREAGIEDAEFDQWTLRQLPDSLGSLDSGVTLAIWGEGRIISAEEGDTSRRLYGAALDLGTSKIVGHLVDLLDGRTLAVTSTDNPQAVHGEDVMSRIAFALRDPGNLEELRRLLLGAVNQVLETLCAEADVGLNEVYEAVVVGNTLMHHIFLGFEVDSLARSPFSPVIGGSLDIAAG
ncbi:MAG: 2Fe-2S iron-sulfur cluster-binding protein, partial [Candidatus Bathyarchaeia archaeon]